MATWAEMATPMPGVKGKKAVSRKVRKQLGGNARLGTGRRTPPSVGDQMQAFENSAGETDWKAYWEATPERKENANRQGGGWWGSSFTKDMVSKMYGQDVDSGIPLYDQYGVYGWEFV